ncbi:hypothetical protein L9F63_018929, partial [Diploptera punctata]
DNKMFAVKDRTRVSWFSFQVKEITSYSQLIQTSEEYENRIVVAALHKEGKTAGLSEGRRSSSCKDSCNAESNGRSYSLECCPETKM